MTTKDKSRLIHAVGLVQLVQDELRADATGRGVANLIGRHLGDADQLVGADGNSAAEVVKRVLAKTTPEKAAGAIVTTIGKVRDTVSAAQLPPTLAARASQLLGMADASAKLAYANLREGAQAPANMRAGYKKPAAETQSELAPASTSAGGFAGLLRKLTGGNPLVLAGGAVAAVAALYALTRKHK